MGAFRKTRLIEGNNAQQTGWNYWFTEINVGWFICSQNEKSWSIRSLYSSGWFWIMSLWWLSETHQGSNGDWDRSYRRCPRLNGTVSSFLPWMWKIGYYMSIVNRIITSISFTFSALLYGSLRRIKHPHVKEEPIQLPPKQCTWIHCCMKNDSCKRNFRILSLRLLLIIVLVEIGCHIASGNTPNYLLSHVRGYLTLPQDRCPFQQRVFSRNHTHNGDLEGDCFHEQPRRCTRTLHNHRSHNHNRAQFPASQ